MISLLRSRVARQALLFALPLALCLMVLFPATSEAHAILLRSDPAKDAVLNTAPDQVRMWFSEDLNPTFSSAVVVNVSNVRVDKNDAHVSSSDSKEMDLSLQPNLSPNVYVVVWRTQSADDGHVLRGSFIFKVAEPDGTVPNVQGTLPGQDQLGGGSSSTGAVTGQLDGPSFFSFVMVTLVDLGVIFWMGAQLWRTFVLQLSDAQSPEQGAIDQSADRRFERVFSLPVLGMLLLANVGVLIGQGLTITGGNWGQVLSFSLLDGLVSNGRFGTYWTMREVVILLAFGLSLYTVLMLRLGRLPRFANTILPWVNLVLGLALLIAVTLSGHAAATSSSILVYAVLADWLHLLAASLWIGGMMYLASVYLPVLKGRPLLERTRALLTTLPQFSPLAIVGVVIMAVTGPFSAAVHMDSLNQLITTAYGRALLVKSLFVGLLLLTSAIHVGLLRPRLAKSFALYELANESGQSDDVGEIEDVEQNERIADTEKTAGDIEAISDIDGLNGTELVTGDDKVRDVEKAGDAQKEDRPVPASALEAKQLETSVASQFGRMTRILRWEPLLGVAVLICVGLMNVFAGTLLPAAANQPQQQQQAAPVKPFNATIKTSDKLFTVKVTVSPNRFGTNVFTVTVLDSKGVQDTNVGVSIYTTMLDMDMGTDTVNLQPDGKGNFKANGDLSMGGNWQLRIEVRTPDFKLHEATVKLFTPF